MKTVLRTKCQLKKRRDKCAQTLRMCSRSQIESDCSQPLLGVGGQFCQFPALALLSGQRLSLTVRLHSPLLNVLSGCLWLGVLYPEVCHFFLWPLDLIPALQRLVPPLYSALKVHLWLLNSSIHPSIHLAIKPVLSSGNVWKKCTTLAVFTPLFLNVHTHFDTHLILCSGKSNCTLSTLLNLLFTMRSQCLTRENQIQCFRYETTQSPAQVLKSTKKALNECFWCVAVL